MPDSSVIEKPLKSHPKWAKGQRMRRTAEVIRAEKLAAQMGAIQAKNTSTVLHVIQGLASLELTDAEICLAVNQQNFNEKFFKESMDIVSNTTVVTAVKLQSQQKRIEKRLENVRQIIEDFGEFQSEERMAWVKEERDLMDQWRKLGELSCKNQDVWYRGAAYLAVIRSRVRGDGDNIGLPNRTQRSGKPGFRPNIVVTQNEPAEVPVPEPDPALQELQESSAITP